jgi:hypothetical protein
VHHTAVHADPFALLMVMVSIWQAHSFWRDLLPSLFHLSAQPFPVLCYLTPNAAGGKMTLANPRKHRLALLKGQQASQPCHLLR